MAKYIDWFLQPGSGTGADFAGDIVALGEKAKSSGLKVGDAVGGFVRSSNDNGGFQGKLLLVDVTPIIKPYYCTEYLVTHPEAVSPRKSYFSIFLSFFRSSVLAVYRIQMLLPMELQWVQRLW